MLDTPETSISWIEKEKCRPREDAYVAEEMPYKDDELLFTNRRGSTVNTFKWSCITVGVEQQDFACKLPCSLRRELARALEFKDATWLR
jgi:hypothetical protein